MDFKHENVYNNGIEIENSIDTEEKDGMNESDKQYVPQYPQYIYCKCLQCSFYNHVSSKKCMVCVMINSWDDKFKSDEYIQNPKVLLLSSLYQ